ncbi:hypothetical protein PULV_a0538 [Pseudoalteromonas ulvae UL12]|uniref:hypothetical protein n=1 Tax=Pseudoalteromonas ulvae TaxID=107327 RepID=UPI00186B5B3A|nr:hypothetical protein [Pseudoalteromonas ulvae]MBE0362937.1 hypothetical protein [Pseudoalteromonas ulvae UL12]
MTRDSLLRQIILFDQPDTAWRHLADFPRLEDAPAILVEKSMLLHVLELFYRNLIDEDALTDWADLISHSDEIEGRSIDDYLYALANPELMGGLTQDSVGKIIMILQSEVAD